MVDKMIENVKNTLAEKKAQKIRDDETVEQKNYLQNMTPEQLEAWKCGQQAYQDAFKIRLTDNAT